MTPEFYTIFWLLTLEKIYVPTGKFQIYIIWAREIWFWNK